MAEEGSLFDTVLLYLYQTIVLGALVAVGFIAYLLRTRAPLKIQENKPVGGIQEVNKSGETGLNQETGANQETEEDQLKVGENQEATNGRLSQSNFQQNDEKLLNAALLTPGRANFSTQFNQAMKKQVEEEEEEEEDGPVFTRKPAGIRQMVIQGQETTQPLPQGISEENRLRRLQEAPINAFETSSPGFSDAMKLEARKRVSQAVQKKQLLELVADGEFDQAITSIRQASKQLQSEGF